MTGNSTRPFGSLVNFLSMVQYCPKIFQLLGKIKRLLLSLNEYSGYFPAQTLPFVRPAPDGRKSAHEQKNNSTRQLDVLSGRSRDTPSWFVL
jgi:hypothetical protein